MPEVVVVSPEHQALPDLEGWAEAAMAVRDQVALVSQALQIPEAVLGLADLGIMAVLELLSSDTQTHLLPPHQQQVPPPLPSQAVLEFTDGQDQGA
jgi:hypothetical protein